MVRFYVGLDLSFRSPGCAIYDAQDDKWCVIGFVTRVRERGFCARPSKNVLVRLLPEKPDDNGDMGAYLHIERELVGTICELIPKKEHETNCRVRLEAYAYVDRAKSGYDYKMHELGGIIKRQLFLSGFLQTDTIVQSSWKAHVVGRGDAPKIHVVHHVKDNAPFLDVLGILGFREEELPLNEKGYRKVPTPCQDWADAICITKSMFVPPPAKKKKPPKPKKSSTSQVPANKKPKTILEALNTQQGKQSSVLQHFIPFQSKRCVESYDDDHNI